MYFYIQPAATFDYPSLSLDDYVQLHRLLRQERQAAMYHAQQQRRIQRALYNLEVMTELYRRRQEEERAIRAYYEQKERQRQELIRQQQLAQQQQQQQRYLAALEEHYMNCYYPQKHQEPFAHHSTFYQESEPEEEEDEDDNEDVRTQQLAALVKLIFGTQDETTRHEEPAHDVPLYKESQFGEVKQQAPFEAKHNEVKHEEPETTMEKAKPYGDMALDDTETKDTNLDSTNDPMEEDLDDEMASADEDVPSLIEPTENIKGLVSEILDASVENHSDFSVFPEEDPVKLAKYEALSRIEQELKDIQQKHEKHILGNTLDFPLSSDGRPLSPDALTATTANNREFLGYEDEIMKVLLKLDTIESDGDEDIRNERKNLVKQAEGLLGTLDEYKQREWERVSSASEDEDAL
ncbi:hypothetical protein CU097_012466 [Rhizopus azygosporus]|uniref:BAG domain-containing protein n=1 Tax=Rhizopus azygosporus TaxID=86630 RepID=A0A367JVX4_RHIAZ|nr:hypothetical protein CU097_012466 [Rhizopus azygosporus]